MYVGPVEGDEPNVLLRVGRFRWLVAFNMPKVPWPPRLDKADRRVVGV